ncbi:MAG: ABC transporter ATP-binding protein [Bacteroidota bacterium]
MSAILEIKNLSKSFNKGQVEAVKAVDFSLEQGKICAIVGASGSGKTTLLRLIAGLERPDEGTISIQQKEVSSTTRITVPQKRNVGMVFQNFALFPHLTVAQNIAFGMTDSQPKKVSALLELINLPAYEQRYPHELSGGEQQRVALARTLATNPKLLLLDEPFSNLDTELKITLRKELYQLVKQIGLAVLFITHDINDAIAIADEVVFFKDGRILEQGVLEQLSKHAQTKEVQATFQTIKTIAKNTLAKLDTPDS